MTIRFAQKRDLSSIHEIWHAAFPQDAVEERERFLCRVDLSTECLLAEEDGLPLSMGFFLPAVLHIESVHIPLRYLYAASTLPAARGKGYFASVLSAAADHWRSTDTAAIYLKPAQSSLVSYYQRLGCLPTIYARQMIGKTQESSVLVSRISSDEYLSLRAKRLAVPHIALDTRFIQYEADACCALRVGDTACALATVQGTRTRIVELLGESTPRTRNAVSQFCGCSEYECLLPSDDGVCVGMVLPLTDTAKRIPSSCYIGLTLD